MKKKILTAFLVLACGLICMLGLSSCGGNTSGGNNDHTHTDRDGNGLCDICGDKVGGGSTTEHRHIDKDDNGMCDICDMELGNSIFALIESLTLDKETLTLDVGDTENLIVTVFPKSSNGTGLTWNSSNENVVTVENGKVTAVSEGTATVYVTAKDENKQSASCVITVNALFVPVASVALDKTELTIEAGDVKTLKAEILPSNATNPKVNWSSSDESIATVEDGKVTAVAIGEATITATTEDGKKTAECLVTVIKPIISVTKVSLDKTSLNLYPGETETLTATVYPDDADNKSILWSSSDASVVRVVNGNITAVREGTATITVTTTDGNKKATCQVVVGDFVYRSIIVDGETIGYAVIGVGTVAGDRLIIPEKHNSKPVIEIGKEAFKDCSKFATVVIPDSVTTIGQDAFSGCTGIKNITSPAFALSYVSRSNLVEVVITSGESIESYAFSGSKSLARITIPSSITTIGNNAFENCKNLAKVSITDIGKWCEISFGTYLSNPLSQGAGLYMNNELVRDVVVPDGIEAINSAFVNYEFLTSLILPNSVTALDHYSFQGCTNLQRIKFGNGITSIADYAFRACDKLEVVEITDLAKWCAIDFGQYSANPLSFSHGFYFDGYPVYDLVISDGITEISPRAFVDCTSFRSVHLPVSLTTLSITTFSGCSNIESVTLPPELISYIPKDNLKAVVISNGVTSISANAFKNYSKLTSITLSMGVTSIGEEAFSGCSSLTSMNISKNVTSIGNNVFLGCSDLTSLTVSEENTKYFSKDNCIIETESKILVFGCKESIIPDDESVTSIGDYAFNGCIGMTSLTIPEGITSIGSYAFQKTEIETVVIPNSMEQIAENAFASCNNITSVTLPISAWKSIAKDSISTVVLTSGESIEDELFKNYKNITTVTLPDELKTIGESAFGGCLGLTEITFPEGLTSIDEHAFLSCSSLNSITIPKDVTTLGRGVFAGCNNISSLTVDEENTSYISKENCIIEIDSKALIQGCKESIIPDDGSATSIAVEAFYGCSGLNSIIIPKSITNVKSDAFIYCSNLKSVTVLCSEGRFGNGAFAYCGEIEEVHINDLADWCSINFEQTSGYKPNDEFFETNPLAVAHKLYLNNNLIEDSLVIPSGITKIGKYVFDGLNSIKSVTIPDSITRIEEGAFTSSNELEEVHISDLSKWCAIYFGTEDSNPLSKAHCLYLNGTIVEDLVIPSDVTTIKDLAFNECSTLSSITIPNTVTSVGYKTFYCQGATVYCEATAKPSGWHSSWKHTTTAVVWNYKTNDTAADGYKYAFIDGIRYAFKDGVAAVAEQLTSISGEITIPETVTYNEATYPVTSVKYMAFNKCTKLTGVVLPNSITTLGALAFYGSGITSITLPNSITSIPGATFQNCSNLVSIVIPDSVETIGEQAFASCISLESVTLSNSLTKINSNVFYYCLSLSTIVISEGIKTIDDYAFWYSGVETITLPASVTYIGSYSFSSTHLETINYNGTMSQWDSVTKKSGWNSIKTIYYVYCSDGRKVVWP